MLCILSYALLQTLTTEPRSKHISFMFNRWLYRQKESEDNYLAGCLIGGNDAVPNIEHRSAASVAFRKFHHTSWFTSYLRNFFTKLSLPFWALLYTLNYSQKLYGVAKKQEQEFQIFLYTIKASSQLLRVTGRETKRCNTDTLATHSQALLETNYTDSMDIMGLNFCHKRKFVFTAHPCYDREWMSLQAHICTQ